MKYGGDKTYYRELVRDLIKQPAETEWFEFKRNQTNPQDIGEYISSLSNSAALAGENFGYVVWGIEDESHSVVGTSFDAAKTKKGNEQLEPWLVRLLEPRVNFSFHEISIEGKRIVLLEIPRAEGQPTRFSGDEYVRVGATNQKLRHNVEKEKALWELFKGRSFEKRPALAGVSGFDVTLLLDCPSYFGLLGIPQPEKPVEVLNFMAADGLVRPSPTGHWDITNLGAILFAHRLSDFEGLNRKAVRVVQYAGDDRVNTRREQTGTRGYACGFEGLIEYVNDLLPANEVLGQALRKAVQMYPAVAIRELIANALIHQDFNVSGAGPMVEVFETRLEITNPGQPLLDPNRFLDFPPRSRNEALASLMRRCGICEERGSGIDKVVFEIEAYQLPAPRFEVPGDNTRVLLFSHRPLRDMDIEDRVRACYQHACLKYVSGSYLTNSSIRKRFGIETKNSSQASRIIKEAVRRGQIVIDNDNAAPKHTRYCPWWAKE